MYSVIHKLIDAWSFQTYLVLLVIIPLSVPACDVAGDDAAADGFVWGLFRLFWNEGYKIDS